MSKNVDPEFDQKIKLPRREKTNNVNVFFLVLKWTAAEIINAIITKNIITFKSLLGLDQNIFSLLLFFFLLFSILNY